MKSFFFFFFFFSSRRRHTRCLSDWSSDVCSSDLVAHEPIDLHICPECDRALVYPVEWEEASSTHWEVQLRCPNCEWLTVGRYDQQLDHGTEALVRDLRRLTRANMEEEIDRFTSALSSDAIWPMDF